MSYCQLFNCTSRSFVFTLTKNQFRLFSMQFSFDSYFHLKISGDVHPNPGPCHGNTFKFCHWNLDSIAVNNFIKIPLIEAYNYDIIALSETYLDSSITIESISLTGFSKQIYRSDHPNDMKRGGFVCILRIAWQLSREKTYKYWMNASFLN